jgi:SAM-dependent methyltransferase
MRPQRLVFGEDAELYDRARPSYPPELIDDLVELVGAAAVVVDAACGTGKAAVQLAQRGLRGVGVEADPAMAAVARRNLEDHPGWRVEVSDFEDWQPRDDDGPFDLVTVAQAWHWIDHERGARAAERLLRPGGVLAIFGYAPVFEETPLRAEIDAIYDELAPEPPAWSKAPAENLPPGAAFGLPAEREYHGETDYTTAEFLDVLLTQSDKRILPADRRELLISRLGAAVEAHGGVYRNRWVCNLWTAVRV